MFRALQLDDKRPSEVSELPDCFGVMSLDTGNLVENSPYASVAETEGDQLAFD